MWLLITAWIAAALVFSSFFMKTMLPLRIVAIVSNTAFICYALDRVRGLRLEEKLSGGPETTDARRGGVVQTYRGRQGGPDARLRLEAWARLLRTQMERSYDIIAVHREAARVDPGAAEEYRSVLDSRAEQMRQLVGRLAPDLRTDLTQRSAIDILWVFSNEELYRELVQERKWAPDRYETWIASSLKQQLLADPGN